MTHNFTKSPQTLGRKGNCTKPKIRHIACHFFEKSTQGVDPFSHSRSLFIGHRQSREAKVDQKVCKSILHPDLTRFNRHIPETLPPSGSSEVHPWLIPGSHLRSFDQSCRTVEALNRANLGQYCLHHVPGLGNHIESVMVRPKGRARELILHNIVACNDQPSLAARTERYFH